MLHKTPRPLLCDAYTLNSGYRFESEEANQFSCYYLTFRKSPSDNRSVFPTVNEVDQRIVFTGLQRILHRLELDKPITHTEIDETVEFLKNRKITTKGLRNFEFPEKQWREVVDKFNGYLPINVDALREGCVAYPHEPVIRVYNTVPGYGFLAAWIESQIIKVWAPTCRLTAARHWLQYYRTEIKKWEPSLSDDEINFFASIMMHDFSDRAGATLQESEDIGFVHLYCFPGTDTFSAAYQAWKSGATQGCGSSVDALAHRIVQGFVDEKDSYETIYNAAEDGDIISLVADCYDYKYAVQNYLLPLALKSRDLQNNRIVVSRPDSGDPLEQILWTLNLAKHNGLVQKFPTGLGMTTLRIIQGDSMTFDIMRRINDAVFAAGFLPHKSLIYGVGGFLRNSISRDSLSTKYALCAVGTNQRPVIKISNTPGKETLPMCTVQRGLSSITLRAMHEDGPDILIPYLIKGEFTLATHDSFTTIQGRVLEGFDANMTKGGQISSYLEDQVKELRGKYVTRSELTASNS